MLRQYLFFLWSFWSLLIFLTYGERKFRRQNAPTANRRRDRLRNFSGSCLAWLRQQILIYRARQLLRRCIFSNSMKVSSFWISSKYFWVIRSGNTFKIWTSNQWLMFLLGFKCKNWFNSDENFTNRLFRILKSFRIEAVDPFVILDGHFSSIYQQHAKSFNVCWYFITSSCTLRFAQLII